VDTVQGQNMAPAAGPFCTEVQVCAKRKKKLHQVKEKKTKSS
jgi:hypothetical protein